MTDCMNTKCIHIRAKKAGEEGWLTDDMGIGCCGLEYPVTIDEEGRCMEFKKYLAGINKDQRKLMV